LPVLEAAQGRGRLASSRVPSARWPSIWRAAYSRHRWRKVGASIFWPTLPCSFSTAISIGSPWQSQPGT